MPEYALEAAGITKFHGEHPALQQVSFGLRRGDVLALLGHNGAGKTTLLNILALLSAPSSGSVIIDGTPASGSARQNARRSIGLIGHQTFLYDELTARENLEFFARLYGVRGEAARISEQLEAVALSDVAGELVRHFSRGMRQRLAVARAFLHQPPLLLLDEPFTGLDDAGVKLLSTWIARARDDGRTVVLSSHDRALALGLATRSLVLERGRAVQLQ